MLLEGLRAHAPPRLSSGSASSLTEAQREVNREFIFQSQGFVLQKNKISGVKYAGNSVKVPRITLTKFRRWRECDKVAALGPLDVQAGVIMVGVTKYIVE